MDLFIAPPKIIARSKLVKAKFRFGIMPDIFYKAFSKFLHEYYKYKVKRIKDSLKYCGERVYLSPDCIIVSPSYLQLENDVCINSFTHIFAHGKVKVGEGTMISTSCSITSVTHPSSSPNRLSEKQIMKPVIIGKNVWIGTGAILLPGITIGDHAIVGAGAVVTKDVLPKTVVVGNPAKFLKYVNI